MQFYYCKFMRFLENTGEERKRLVFRVKSLFFHARTYSKQLLDNVITAKSTDVVFEEMLG